MLQSAPFLSEALIRSPLLTAGARTLPGRGLRARLPWALLAALLFPAIPVRGDSAPGTGIRDAVRSASPPRIDGILDEAVWKDALVVDDFTQQLPRDQVPPSETTEARILYDDDNLYLGIRLFDRDPSGLIAWTLARDSFAISGDDQLAFCIDSSDNGRDGFWFSTNPAGVLVDAQIFNEGQVFDDPWNAIWEVSTRVDAEGWTAEIRIPFFNLRFAPSDKNVMGINFFRAIRRKNEEDYAPYIPRNFHGTLTLSRAPKFRFTGIRRGVRALVKPYVLGRREARYVPGDDDASDIGRAGLDVKWGVSSNLTADLTYHTDFAQVEADIQQVNLTRFKLFYPEKREFFLENAGLFQFGDAQETDVFFSRRIGLTESGEVVPIEGGARLTGRLGKTSLGFLDVVAEPVSTEPRTNFSVVRLRQDILARSTVGLIYTDREASGSGEWNRVGGGDARIVFREDWSVDAYYAASRSSPGLPEGSASRVRVGRDGDTWQAAARFAQVDPGFDPGVGFVVRTDMDSWQGLAAWKPRPHSDTIRQYNFSYTPTYITDRQGQLQSRRHYFLFETNFETGDVVGLYYDAQFERIPPGGFDIFPDPGRSRGILFPRDIVIPEGDYSFASTGLYLDTYQGRRVNSSSILATGPFYDGRKSFIYENLTVKFSPHFSLATEYDYNHVLLPEGNFDTNLWITRLNVALSPKLFGSALIQVNDIPDNLDLNLRVDWIHHPGADLFFVYDESSNLRRRLDEPRLNFRDTTFKLTYLFQF